jgi:hypothetical protein
MALSIDHATKKITIPQSYLTFVSGTTYELNTETFRTDMNALMDDEEFIYMDDYAARNAPYTIVGTTYAQSIEIINGWHIFFENLSYSVRLNNSNNNFFDVDGGIIDPSPLVTVIPQNSAGLINVSELARLLRSFAYKQYTNSATGNLEIYDDDGVKIQDVAIWEDDGITAWDGTGPIVRRDTIA